MRGVAHDKHASLLQRCRIGIVYGPSIGREEFDFQFWIAHQLASHACCKFRCHLGRRFIDVISPDDQPFVPWTDHTHQSHAYPSNIGPRLHNPVKDRWTVRDVFGQVRLEQDVHRTTDAHLPLDWGIDMFGNQ